MPTYGTLDLVNVTEQAKQHSLKREPQDKQACSERIMKGVITSADILRNMRLIWREFGPLCLLRCFCAILRSEPTTFLQIAVVPRARS